MSLVIGTNASALYSQNAMKTNARSTATTMERLSTGVRVNSARDDAAGLAIGQNMTSQIRGLDQAVRNINDGINLVQTAEGGLNSVSNMLQRMRELAVQASNGTYSDVQRGYLNQECQQLQTAISQVVGTTMWNDQKLLDGTFSQPIQIGSDVDAKMDIVIPALPMTPLPVDLDIKINPVNGHSYKLVNHGQSISWTDAKVAAESMTINGQQGYLATITSAQENEFVINEVGVVTAWIGASDAAQEGTWQWVTGPEAGTIFQTGNAPTGSTQGYTNWQNGEPNDSGGEDYGHILGTGWNDYANNGPVSNYVVEFTGTANVVSFGFDITTAAKAITALGAIDLAIDGVNGTRATLGSYINRLAYAADNVTNISSNATQSRSSIIDADYAIETTNLAKNQIIQQAATAMLAQANAQPQAVMALLKNLTA